VFDRLFLPLLLSHAYTDKEGQEVAIRASSLDLVIVRPAMLTNDPARGSVRAVTDLAGVNGGKIAGADVARFVVEQLTMDIWLANTSYLVVKGAENSRLICGFVAHQRRNDPV
jgi:uncharacterized protein YbjT (DUF2867 family)